MIRARSGWLSANAANPLNLLVSPQGSGFVEIPLDLPAPDRMLRLQGHGKAEF